MNKWSLWLCFVAVLMVAGCTTPGSGMIKPDVQLAYVVPQTAEAGLPGFRVGLRVINPNRDALDIRGLYVSLRLQEFKVMSGITNEPRHIEAYGEGVIEVMANASLVGSMRTLGALLANPERPLDYQLEARIDTGWWRGPVTLMDKGSIVLGGDRLR